MKLPRFKQEGDASESTKGVLVAITGPSGSTGKTTIASNLAALLASEKKSVILVDADFLGSGCPSQFSINRQLPGLTAAIRLAEQNRFDEQQLERLVYEIQKNRLYLLANSAGLLVPPNANNLSVITEQLLTSFDYVVVDLPALVVPSLQTPANCELLDCFMQRAEYVFAVALADPLGIARWLRVEKVLEQKNIQPKLIINRLRNSAIESAKREIQYTLAQLGSYPIAGFLPDDPVPIDRAIRQGLPLAMLSRSSPFRHSLWGLTQSLILGRTGMLDSRLAKLG